MYSHLVSGTAMRSLYSVPFSVSDYGLYNISYTNHNISACLCQGLITDNPLPCVVSSNALLTHRLLAPVMWITGHSHS